MYLLDTYALRLEQQKTQKENTFPALAFLPTFIFRCISAAICQRAPLPLLPLAR